MEKLDAFVYWAVYRLRDECPNKEGKAKMFSLLHIGGEACAAYHALYTIRNITPRMISFIRPGVGYGDNWTNFFDTNHVLYKLVKSVEMPEYIMQTHENVWPEYSRNPLYQSVEYDTETAHELLIKIFQKFDIGYVVKKMFLWMADHI